MNSTSNETRTYLNSQTDAQTEWWYYSGYLTSGHLKFGFQFTFFGRRPTNETILGLVPLKWISPKFRFAHFAISDFENHSFRFAHRRSIRLLAGEKNNPFRIWMQNWSVQESDGHHLLTATMRGIGMELDLTPLKGEVCHPRHRSPSENGAPNLTHFSIPRMAAKGNLRIRGKDHAVEGYAWMDREFGRLDFEKRMGGWDWFSIQLDDFREIMAYCLFDEARNYNSNRRITLIHKDGTQTQLLDGAFELIAEKTWTSRWTKTTYPSGWLLRVPEWKAELRIVPRLPFQELDSRGSTSIIYWEGAAEVTGKIEDRLVTGNAFVELVGYNESHRILANPRIGMAAILRAFQNDWYYHVWHHGITRRESEIASSK